MANVRVTTSPKLTRLLRNLVGALEREHDTTLSPYTIAFRAGAVTLSGLLALLFDYPGRHRVLAVAGAIVAVYILLHAIRAYYNPRRIMSSLIFGFDYIAITSFIAVTGGVASDAFIIYYLAVAFVALSLGAAWSALASAAAMVAYLSVSLHIGFDPAAWPRLLYRLSSLGLLALIAGLRAEKIHGRVEQLDQEVGRERQLSRQLNTVQDINREISAETDLDRILRLLLQRALELLDGTHGAVALPDKLGRWTVRVQVNFPPDFEGFVVQPGIGAMGTALKTQAPVILNRYHERAEAIQEISNLRLTAALGLPVMLNNRLVGLLALGTTAEGREFHSSDLELVRMLADQAAVAIANAQLVADSKRRADNLVALFEASQALTATFEREAIFEAIYNGASTVMPVDAFFICLYNEALAELDFVFLIDAGLRYPPQRKKLADNPTSRVIRERKPIIANLEPGQLLNGAQTMGDDGGLTASLLIVPLIAGERVLGAISAQSYTYMAYSNEDLNMLTILANQAAIQLANTVLFETTLAMALTDNLTGLGNSRQFQEQLEREMARAQRGGKPLSLIMLDSDSLKSINDRYGHAVGNAHLLAIASAIRESTRRGDVTCRYAGDEFMIILPDTDEEAAVAVAERIRQAVASAPLEVGTDAESQPLFTTVSIGVATFPRHGETPDALLRAADTAMYRAKYLGKNCVAVYA